MVIDVLAVNGLSSVSDVLFGLCGHPAGLAHACACACMPRPLTRHLLAS